MNQRLERIDGLHPMLHKPAMEFIKTVEDKLSTVLMVVYGWRSIQEQMLIYQKGRRLNPDTGLWEITDKSQLVTRALPGTSAHNVITMKGDRAAMAMDVVPLLADNTANWNVTQQFLDKLYAIAWDCGLDPLGDEIGAYLEQDKLHFEEPNWKMKLEGLGCMLPVQPAPAQT